MRLAAVTTYATHPPRRGGQVRTAALLSRAPDGWQVDSYSLTIQRSDLPWPRTEHPVTERWTDHRTRDPLFFAWTALCGRLGQPPAYASAIARAWPRPGVTRALRGADVVWVAHPHHYQWVRRRTPRSTPAVLDAHNIEEDLVDPAATGWRGRFAAEVIRAERTAMADAALVLVTSSEEGARAADMGARSTLVVPNGVDVERFRPATDEERGAIRVQLGLPASAVLAIMTGSAHRPNVEAVELLEGQADQYRAAGVTLLIVGRCGLGRRSVPGVIHAGEVADVVPWLQASDIGLAPLVSGSGTSLKTVEFLAAGLPVVSTPVGVRGLELEPGSVVVSTAAEMPKAVAELAADPERAGQLRAAGRTTAEQRFSWDRGAADTWAAIDSLGGSLGGSLAGD